MARAFHEILPALDLIAGIGDLNAWAVIEEQQFPAAERKADVEGEAEIMRGRDIGAGGQRLDIAEEVVDVLWRHARIGTVGE